MIAFEALPGTPSHFIILDLWLASFPPVEPLIGMPLLKIPQQCNNHVILGVQLLIGFFPIHGWTSPCWRKQWEWSTVMTSRCSKNRPWSSVVNTVGFVGTLRSHWTFTSIWTLWISSSFADGGRWFNAGGGKYSKSHHTQWDTIRKLRSAYSNQVTTSANAN